MTKQLERNALVVRSNSYYREGALDSERWAKIAEIPDYDELIDRVDWSSILKAPQKELVFVLDCGCGLGYFPQQLQRRVTFPSDVAFDYDTIDPSPYSLTEHRKRLQGPFSARHSFNIAIEEFCPVSWVAGYDIIWCMHSLYTVPRSRLPDVLATLNTLLNADGRCFIFLPEKKSSYMVLFDLYRGEMPDEQIEPYLTAEEVLAELVVQRRRSIDRVDCVFDHHIEAAEPQTLATYLNQICLRSTPLSFAEWQQNSAFTRYLTDAFDPGRPGWCFHQRMTLISFARTE